MFTTAGEYTADSVKHCADTNKPTNNNVSLTNIRNITPTFNPLDNDNAIVSLKFSVKINNKIKLTTTIKGATTTCVVSASTNKPKINKPELNKHNVVLH
jgi:hypothetical protein